MNTVRLGSRACQTFLEFERQLVELEKATPRGGDLAVVLALARDRLDAHHLRPYRPIVEEHGLGRAA